MSIAEAPAEQLSGSQVPGAQEDEPNFWGITLLVAYFLVRTAFLTTVEAPEPRYIVTCYPAVLALASLVWIRKSS